jgi:hypothetical protein
MLAFLKVSLPHFPRATDEDHAKRCLQQRAKGLRLKPVTFRRNISDVCRTGICKVFCYTCLVSRNKGRIQAEGFLIYVLCVFYYFVLCPANAQLLYTFFWVILWRLNFICQRFGTLCLFHLHRRVRTKNYPEESIQHSGHGESLKCTIVLQIITFLQVLRANTIWIYRASTTVASTYRMYIRPPHRLTSWEL